MPNTNDPERYEKTIRWLCAVTFAGLAVFALWDMSR